MQENQKPFIKRHLRLLLIEKEKPDSALVKALSILDSENDTEEALSILERSGSLTKTLHEIGVIKLEPDVLDAISIQESENENNDYPISTLLETEETIDEVLALLKTKLHIGLAYALWLSTIATIVFTIISQKVIPQFQGIFVGFGAELPSFTKFAISWQASYFSPGIIGVLFCILLVFLLYALKKLSIQSNSQSVYSRIPFIKKVFRYTKCIHWLSQLQILITSGLSIEESQKKLSSKPKDLTEYLPTIIKELLVAESIGNVIPEIDFQVHQLNHHAEDLITKTTRSLLAVIMACVVGYVIFTIFASYLPIFQLGAVV